MGHLALLEHKILAHVWGRLTPTQQQTLAALYLARRVAGKPIVKS